MSKQNYFIMFLVILGVQLLICNYFHISAYITLSILPCTILLLPTKVGTSAAMLIAFAAGLAVDLLADGVPGLNALALVPVAGSRRIICDFIFGKELTLTGEDVSMSKFGIGKMTLAVTTVQAIFLVIYIWADGAAARTSIFNLLRFSLSLVTGTALSLVVADLLDPNVRK